MLKIELVEILQGEPAVLAEIEKAAKMAAHRVPTFNGTPTRKTQGAKRAMKKEFNSFWYGYGASKEIRLWARQVNCGADTPGLMSAAEQIFNAAYLVARTK